MRKSTCQTLTPGETTRGWADLCGIAARSSQLQHGPRGILRASVDFATPCARLEVNKRLWRRLAPAPGRHIRADRAPDSDNRSLVAICRATTQMKAPGEEKRGTPRVSKVRRSRLTVGTAICRTALTSSETILTWTPPGMAAVN